MKTANVPAQITTVEDKIAGNLTLQQMVLLASPVFIDFALYAVLPTTLKLNIYKLVLMAVITLISGLASIRVRSNILLTWAITILKYNARPRHYVFNKNNEHFRDQVDAATGETEPRLTPEVEQTVHSDLSRLSEEDIFKLEYILSHPSANLSFSTSKKGGLYASISEIK